MEEEEQEEVKAEKPEGGVKKPDELAGLRKALLAGGVEFTDQELNYISNNLMSKELRDAIDREDENDTLYALGIGLGGDLVKFGLGLGVFSSDAWTSMLAREQDIDRKLRTNQFLSKGLKKAMRESAIRPFKALQAERATRAQATMSGGPEPVTAKAIAASEKDDSIAEAMGSTIAQQNAAIIKAELSERTRLEKEGTKIDATKLAMWEGRLAKPGGIIAENLSDALQRLYASKQKEDIEYAVSVMRAAGMSNSEILVALNKSRTLKGKGQTEWLLNEAYKLNPELKLGGDAPAQAPVAPVAPVAAVVEDAPPPLDDVTDPIERTRSREGREKTVRDWMESMPLPVGGMAGEPAPESHYDERGRYIGPPGPPPIERREGESQRDFEARGGPAAGDPHAIMGMPSFPDTRQGARAKRQWLREYQRTFGEGTTSPYTPVSSWTPVRDEARDTTKKLFESSGFSEGRWDDFTKYVKSATEGKEVHQISTEEYEHLLEGYKSPWRTTFQDISPINQ